MFVGAVFSRAVVRKFAINFGMYKPALLAEFAVGKMFAILCRMEIWTIILIFAVRKMLALWLFLNFLMMVGFADVVLVVREVNHTISLINMNWLVRLSSNSLIVR